MKRLVKAALELLGYRIEGTRMVPRPLLDPRNLRALELDDVICRRMFEVGQDLCFVQVGVYDGVTGDPLHRYIERCGWRGLLVEPQVRAVEGLRARYRGNDRIEVVAAAIDRRERRRTLYTVRSDVAPAWAGGLASFDRANILKHAALVPGLAGSIVEEEVECLTFEAVLARLPAERLDLLQIDVEGGDAELLAMFPFERVRPAIVHWEVKHLDQAARAACLERLLAHGYRLAQSGGENMLAVLA